MKNNQQSNGSKPEKRNPFTVINNVRKNCKQPVPKKFLMLILSTYCNADGICFPGNSELADAMNKSYRTVRRMLKELKADGELEILRPGIGRDTKRVIRLTKYAGFVPFKGDKAMTCLNGTRSLGKTSRNTKVNNHKKGKGSLTPLRFGRTVSVFVPKVPYPETEDEMYATLERRGIEPNPDYDGNFFAQNEASNWTINGKPVVDWPATYQARLEKTMP
jgi:hypothetical protein